MAPSKLYVLARFDAAVISGVARGQDRAKAPNPSPARSTGTVKMQSKGKNRKEVYGQVRRQTRRPFLCLNRQNFANFYARFAVR